jgi:hypothetical protein
VVDHRNANGGDGEAHELAALKEELSLLRLQRGAPDETGIAEPALAKRLDRLASEMAALQTQMQHIIRTVATLSADGDGAGPDLVPVTEIDLEAMAQEEEYQAQERIARLNTGFEAERTDIQWSPEATDSITRAFESEELARSTLYGVECRSTTCRVEVEHENAADLSDFELWFPLQVGDTLPKFTMRHEEQSDGRVSTVVYMMRDGFSMPEFQ